MCELNPKAMNEKLGLRLLERGKTRYDGAELCVVCQMKTDQILAVLQRKGFSGSIPLLQLFLWGRLRFACEPGTAVDARI